jgi:hypothetical protein
MTELTNGQENGFSMTELTNGQENGIGGNAKEFGHLSGKYNMELIVGDAVIENPFSWPLVSSVIENPFSWPLVSSVIDNNLQARCHA